MMNTLPIQSDNISRDKACLVPMLITLKLYTVLPVYCFTGLALSTRKNNEQEGLLFISFLQVTEDQKILNLYYKKIAEL